jgi:hypothetical protein
VVVTASIPPDQGLTIEALASTKKLSVEFLSALGVRTDVFEGRSRVRIPYADEIGEVKAVHYRHTLAGDIRFTWRQGDHSMVYGLPRLLTVYRHGWCLLLEGESDCWTAWSYQLPALGIPGQIWKPEWSALLSHPNLIVYLWHEPGATSLLRQIAQHLPHARVLVPPDGLKDLSEAHVCGDNIPALVERLKTDARSTADILSALEERERFATGQGAETLLEGAGGLLDDPRLLHRIGRALRANGFAGSTKAARLVYLVLLTGMLHRPTNLHVDGPSAVGKNYLLNSVLALIPDEAVYLLTASSERTFVYTEDPLAHRHIVIAESAGLHQDGVGATIMRSLTWDGTVTYEVVEKQRDGSMKTRKIHKPGPTGCITTSVKPLDEELRTRFLTVSLRDDPAQTKLILQALGRQATIRPPHIDTAAFLTAYRWLRVAGCHDVVIPFGKVLGDLFDSSQVRARRDFPQLLSLISASAVLYQRQRERDEQGRILASFLDYAAVFFLVADVFGAAKSEVTKTQREAIDAVAALCAEARTDGGAGVDSKTKMDPATTTVTAVAERLRISRQAARKRLTTPLALGFVVNHEIYENRPAKLAPGEAPPDDRPAIPRPRTLREAYKKTLPSPDPPESGCAVAPDENVSETREKSGDAESAGGATPSEHGPGATLRQGGILEDGARENPDISSSGGSRNPVTPIPEDQPGEDPGEGHVTWRND